MRLRGKSVKKLQCGTKFSNHEMRKGASSALRVNLHSMMRIDVHECVDNSIDDESYHDDGAHEYGRNIYLDMVHKHANHHFVAVACRWTDVGRRK
jgi:hypothetical protein